MRRARGKWTWSQLDRRDSDFVSVMLLKKNYSIAIVFPRPPGWIGERSEDRELIRGILFEAAEEPWGLPAPRE